MTAVALIHRDSIIAQIAQGKRLSDIAPALGVIPNAISKVLKSDPVYRDAIEAGFHCRLDAAERDLESAAEQVDVARARARFQSVAWRAEREFSETWGQKNQVNHTVTITLGDKLLQAEARVIDVAPMPITALECGESASAHDNDESVVIPAPSQVVDT